MATSSPTVEVESRGLARSAAGTGEAGWRGTVARASRMTDYWLITYRRSWRGTVTTAFVSPVLFLIAMGVLLGGFVTGDPARLDGAPTYLAFVAPGLLAGQVMQVAMTQSTFPVFSMTKWSKAYWAMWATSLQIGDLVLAHVVSILVRGLLTAVVFTAVLVPFGVIGSWWGPLAALPVLVLLAAAFCLPTYAYAAGVTSEKSFTVILRLVMVPIFLFSGAFFPVANLPDAVEWVAYATPLWHGVDLTRGLFLGQASWGLALVNIAVLAAYAGVGAWLAPKRLTKRMVA